MKKIFALTIVLAGLLTFISCDSITTSFDTDLSTTVLADVAPVKSGEAGIKETGPHPFSATKVLKIDDNSQIKDYFDRLKEINVKNITATFTGIPSGESITTLNLTIQSAGIDIALDNIVNGASVTLEVSPQLLDALSAKLLEDKEVTVGVSGNSTFAPMVLSTLVEFAVTVKAGLLD